jgi:hypothetical protein
MKRAWKMAVALLLLCSNTPGIANAQAGYGVEGHVFNAETGRPLANAFVELYAFPIDPGFGVFGIGNVTDDGGFYRFEFQPLITNADGDDVTAGYAFAYSCNGVVQIVPLYTKLHSGRVYQRNVYLNVPANLRRCD